MMNLIVWNPRKDARNSFYGARAVLHNVPGVGDAALARCAEPVFSG